ncbi:MAG TPA: nucleotide exchange factor GrpE [Candidatus Salinicoccus stercoripullorum]|uniref:Protein GrpE n=1 Tax=Candidatus Salinicoccus stercoripullorum TaxID=2838756 RepID=A0A9D1QGV7_9STAP|nr:nucleotide exchange factor GrpE [Candidatus Salinicoccus stercoripullorum]
MVEKEKNEEVIQDENLAPEDEPADTASEAEESVEASVEEVPETDPKDAEIESLKEQVEAEENKYLKMLAEFENYKRRTKQEIELNNKYKDQNIAESLLPILDNLERALKIEGETEAFKSLSKGVEMVYNDLVNTLMSHDINEIKATGEVFDPNYHQAVMTEASGDEPGIIIEEFQKGYTLKDRVIRASMVKVSE